MVFICWTKTLNNDEAFRQIKFTHKPSKKLEDILNKNLNIFKSIDKFLKTVRDMD